MDSKKKFACTDETVNALVDLVAAVTLALCITLPGEQRRRFANNLARLAAHAGREGNAVLQTALEDVQRMVAR